MGPNIMHNPSVRNFSVCQEIQKNKKETQKEKSRCQKTSIYKF